MSGIDFFKSCTTNVRTIESIYDLRCLLFSPAQGGDQNGEIHQAVADLRGRNVLCTSVREELWIFVTLEDAFEVEFDLQRYGLQRQDLEWAVIDPPARNGDDSSTGDIFLAAIEGSISYMLFREHGIAHIGHFAWAFLGPEGDDADSHTPTIVIQVEAKLADKLTENASLYISTSTTRSQIRRIQRPDRHMGRTILLAPSGRRAKLATDQQGEDLVLAQPPAFNPSWNSRISNTVLAEGVGIATDEAFLLIEISDGGKKKRFSWPQRFCFVSGEGANKNSFSEQDWTHWFGVTTNGFKNPLADAEEWFKGAPERERMMNSMTYDQNLMSNGGPAHSANIVAETPLATSPPFNQRLMDQQAALSGIYPTPPDGLIPGHLPQQPTSDGTNGAMQVEHSGLGNELQLPSSDDNHLGASSGESNGEAQAYQPISDDLFGDMGEMDFGANEVGDADFDYFDEPDDLPQPPTADQDTEMIGADTSLEPKHDVDSKSHEDALSDQDMTEVDDLKAPESRPTSSHDQTGEDLGPGLIEGPKLEVAIPARPSPPAKTRKEPEKPLDPWGIRLQLLPMVPASAVSDATQSEPNRRASDFKPIAFNENLDLASKYVNRKHVDFAKNIPHSSIPSIALPPKRKKTRSRPAHDPDSGVTDSDSSSEDDSYESTTSMSDEDDLPPRLPWDTKKRKRSSWHEQATSTANVADGMWPVDDVADSGVNEFDVDSLSDVLDDLLYHRVGVKAVTLGAPTASSNGRSELATLPLIEEMFEFGKMDLVYVAQIAGEQAVSSIPSLLRAIALDNPLVGEGAISPALETIIGSTADKIIPTVEDCSMSSLALVKEPPQRPIMNPGKAPQTGQPRPPQREGSMQLGPDYFSIPPPFIRVQRGSDTWEMLPPALSFWSALGLGPASGPKDVTPVAIVPGNSDLVGLVQDFVKELGGVYEGRKLGSFSKTPEVYKLIESIPPSDDGCVLVSIEDEPPSVDGAIKAIADVCEDVGRALADIAHANPDRTVVIVMVDPFENEQLHPYLAACFWTLCKAYRQHIPKAHMKSPCSDLVLQILPVSLAAAPDQLVILDTQHLSTLAMEVYDRCPPSSKAMIAMDTSSALPIPAAPAIELASVPPKRIAFQLVPDPPGDLMHEGSIIHLAYALTADMQWMAANWIDSTGRYQIATSTSLRGKTFQDVAAEIWERTLDILTARDVTWRIFIVAGVEMDASEASCWRSLAASKPRRQILHVTLLSVETETSLQLTPPPPLDNISAAGLSGQAGQFLTPGSTPQGTAMTVSPDASGTAAPPTPAPTDSTPGNAENDPDAHLIDITDESWAMLLATSFTSSTSYRAEDAATQPAITMAKGVLFRRGDQGHHASSDKLESLGVNLHWDIRMRTNGAVDEGPIRQAEVTLREVLRMYRSLGLLGRARNVHVARDSRGGRMVPVHLAAATRAAEALSWFRVSG